MGDVPFLHAVVGEKEDHGVIFEVQLPQSVQQPADICVQLCNHSVKLRQVPGQAAFQVLILIMLWDLKWDMRRVIGQIEEEWAVSLSFDEANRRICEDVSDEPVRADGRAIEFEDGIPIICQHSVTKTEKLVEALCKWAILLIPAEVPLAYHRSAVTLLFQ